MNSNEEEKVLNALKKSKNNGLTISWPMVASDTTAIQKTVIDAWVQTNDCYKQDLKKPDCLSMR